MEEKCMENWKVNRTETEIIGKMKIVSENQKDIQNVVCWEENTSFVIHGMWEKILVEKIVTRKLLF